MCLRDGQILMTTILRDIDYICKKNNINYWIESGTLLGAVRHGGFIPWDDDIDIAMPREDYNKFIEIANSELPDDLELKNMKNTESLNYHWSKVIHKYSKFIEDENFNDSNGIFVDIFPYDYYSSDNLDSILKYKKNLKFNCVILNYSNRKFCQPYKENLKKNIKIITSKIIKLFLKCDNYEKLYKKIDYITQEYKEEDKKEKIGYGLEVSYYKTCFDVKDIFPLRRIVFENITVMSPNNSENCLKTMYGENYMELPKKEERVWHNKGIYIEKYRE